MFATLQSNHGARKVLLGGVMVLMGIASGAVSASPASAAVSASPASASTSSVTVRYVELDLSRSAGAQVLYNRIQQAALEVCNGFVGPFSEMHTRASPCYKDAVENAVAQVNSPQLSAIHRTSRLARS